MSLNKQEFWRDIPILTWDYTPGSSHNSRKTMRLPPHHKRRPESPALHAEQFCIPHQHKRSLDFLDGTPESHQDHCHKSRGTLRSLQQHEELQVPQIILRWELTAWLQLKRNGKFPQAPQEEASLSYRYVRGTLSLLPQVERTLRCPYSK